MNSLLGFYFGKGSVRPLSYLNIKQLSIKPGNRKRSENDHNFYDRKNLPSVSGSRNQISLMDQPQPLVITNPDNNCFVIRAIK